MKKLGPIGWFVLGFLSYPFLFVPLLWTVCPPLMEWWIQVYADYLRLLGF